MKFLSQLLLILILSLASFQLMASDKAQNQYAEKDFDRAAVYDLCAAIKGKRGKEVIHEKIDAVRNMAGVSKEDWNKHYAFKVTCSGAVLLTYALTSQFEDFQALVDYGIDLNHYIKVGSKDITTTKDLADHKYSDRSLPRKERMKWGKILKYARKHKLKDCKEQPELKCTATYLK